MSVILFGLVVFIPSSKGTADCLISLDSISDQWLKGKEQPQDMFIMPNNCQFESPELYLIQKSSLLGIAPPVMVTPQVLGVILGESEPEVKKEVIEYQVQPGDTLTGIAEDFSISLNTLLWANNITKSSTLKAGQELVILPVSGVVHYVKSGDTISAIALKYKTKSEEIIAFNELSSEGDIFVGDILIIPGGIMPSVPKSSASQYTFSQVPIASSYFICPIAPPCRITQRLHWYNAIDFSHGKCGESIFAAAGGTVQRVKYGYNSGAGNYLTILHPNGVVTSYGHIATFLVSPGDQVSQGQIIALMGGQPGTPGAGRSTGCHVHFGVQGARNPFSR